MQKATNTNGVTTTFTLDLNSALAQLLAAQGGGSQSLFLPGVGQQVNGDWLFSHGDALGSVRHVTGAAGELLGSMSYSPFGERVESTGVLPFLGFTGEPQQPASDLTYLRARYYHPALGRFLTVDPFPGYLELPATLHPYVYVLNDPLNLTDPGGNNPLALVALGFLAGFGGNIIGQVVADGWHSWACIDWGSAFIAGAVGATAGFLTPVFATSIRGAVTLGGLTNTAQYALTQWARGEQPTGGGLTGSAILGGIGGWIAGSYQPLEPIFDTNYPFSRMLRTYPEFIRQNKFQTFRFVTGTSVRAFGAGIFTNTDLPDLLNTPFQGDKQCGPCSAN